MQAAFTTVGGCFLRILLCIYAISAVPVAVAAGRYHGEWLWGLIMGVLSGMLISVLIQAHEERLGRRTARILLRRLARRGAHRDAMTLAALEALLDEGCASHVLSCLGDTCRWGVSLGVGVGVFWAGLHVLPVDSATARGALAVGLGLIAWKLMHRLLRCDTMRKAQPAAASHRDQPML